MNHLKSKNKRDCESYQVKKIKEWLNFDRTDNLANGLFVYRFNIKIPGLLCNIYIILGIEFVTTGLQYNKSFAGKYLIREYLGTLNFDKSSYFENQPVVLMFSLWSNKV